MKSIFEAATKFELVEAKTPGDFTEMYRHCPSCMKITKEHMRKPMHETILRSKGLWPSAFYAYVPKIRGIIFKMNGEIKGRTIIQGNNAISPGYCIKCGQFDLDESYDDDCGFHGPFEATLRKAKIKICGYTSMDFPKELKIPGILCSTKFWLPMPCIDSLDGQFFVRFNVKTHSFCIRYEEYGYYGNPNDNWTLIANHAGWVCSDKVVNF